MKAFKVGIGMLILYKVHKILRRVVSRIGIWLAILKQFRPLTIHSGLNLLISSALEIIASPVVELSNPRLWLKGLDFYYSKSLRVLFCVRGGKDDIYQIISYREGDVQRIVESSLSEDDVFVDIGANVGFYTVLAALRGAQVFSVEAIPSTATVLKINVKLNKLEDRVKVINKCASDSKKRVSFCIPAGHYYGLATMNCSKFSAVEFIEVECEPLDEVLKCVNHIRAIKIDVEGSELAVLNGLRNTLKRVDLVIVEVSNAEVYSMLKEHGFKIYSLKHRPYIAAVKAKIT